MYKKNQPSKSFFSRIIDTVRMRDLRDYDDDYDNELPDDYDNDYYDEDSHQPDEDIIEKDTEPEGELEIDMFQTHSAIIIQAITAGVKLNDIDIEITRESVSIRGTRIPNTRASAEDYFTQELYWGSFAKDIQLPFEVDIDEAEAIEDHGLLTLTLPKLNKDRRTTVKVKSI